MPEHLLTEDETIQNTWPPLIGGFSLKSGTLGDSLVMANKVAGLEYYPVREHYQRTTPWDRPTLDSTVTSETQAFALLICQKLAERFAVPAAKRIAEGYEFFWGGGDDREVRLQINGPYKCQLLIRDPKSNRHTAQSLSLDFQPLEEAVVTYVSPYASIEFAEATTTTPDRELLNQLYATGAVSASTASIVDLFKRLGAMISSGQLDRVDQVLLEAPEIIMGLIRFTSGYRSDLTAWVLFLDRSKQSLATRAYDIEDLFIGL
jgi:hypothetical protein